MLRAIVAVPDVKVSDDVIDFEAVQCGQCKVVTIQLHNQEQVRCEWSAVNPENKKDVVSVEIILSLSLSVNSMI